jgi:hypothetical protein
MARPKYYEKPEDLDAKVDEYVALQTANQRPISWTGMALHLGFFGRQELDNYADYDGFSDSIKRAKTIVENYYEEATMTGDIPVAMGVFGLKNFKWKDKFDEEANRNLPPIIIQTYRDDETN